MRALHDAAGDWAMRCFDTLLRQRSWVLFGLTCGVVAGLIATLSLPVDMSFRPTFIGDEQELKRTHEHERVFGQVGFRDLVAIADVADASDSRALAQVAQLAKRLALLPNVVEVRDPLHFPFFDEHGMLHPGGVMGSLAPGVGLDSAEANTLIAQLLHSAPARRMVVGDGDRRVAVTASLDLPNEDFSKRREAVLAFRNAVHDWSVESGYATQVTGYPEVEQVYAHEVLLSVFRSIGALLLMMLGILLIYFRRLRDVVTCLAGVTLAVPLVLGLMSLLGQPFSIVNSQVLTLVLIVGIGQALHHQEEYRRRREAGRPHALANREAFAILAWPSFMTGFATIAGFAALLTADMRAIWSFGLSTALGVALVYAVNWLVVPLLIAHFHRNEAGIRDGHEQRSWTLSVVRNANALLQSRPGWVATGFVVGTLLLAGFGIARLSVDQRVNEELPASHSAVRAEQTYEREFAGFLGPELAIRALAPDLALRASELAAFVNRLCDMPEVRYVASPLDLSPQRQLPGGAPGKACQRAGGALKLALAARSGAAGEDLQRLAHAVMSASPAHAAVVIRVADMGTAQSLPFVERIRAAAQETMPHAVAQPVGQWWLAQQGMNRLSFDMMLSALTALLVILPVMWFAIRDFKLFLAAIPPTVLPVFATLGFMGLLHITVRIGTAMILAIALGLAADDTIHLSVRIRDRIRAGSDARSAVTATLLRTGRPCSFSSYVLIGGFASMLASSLLALKAMGLIAVFSMSFALGCDVVLGPALYLLLAKPRRPIAARATSLAQLLEQVVREHPERPAISYRLEPRVPTSGPVRSSFRSLSWHETAHALLNVADELERSLGSERVIAVLAETDARYPLFELAVVLTGRTLQPLYVSSSDDELRHALECSGARVLVAGTTQLARAQRSALCPRVLELNAVVRLPGVDGAPHAALPAEIEAFDSSSVRARLLALPQRPAQAPSLYVQSTGTTGPARLIVISEASLIAATHAAASEAAAHFPRFLAFLPTAHISERLLTVYVSLALAGHTFYGGGLPTLSEDLRACLPTALLTPPALLETLRDQARANARRTAPGRWLLAAAQRSADALLNCGVVGGARRNVGALLFGARLRRAAGLYRVRDFLAGAAPVPAALHAWCEAAGLHLRIVYGQTELIGATSFSPRIGAHFGAVGLPATGIELRLSQDHELLVRSQARFGGYLTGPQTAEATQEGDWLHSGDRARFLPSGEIVLLGRMQAVLRARGGSRVDSADIAAALQLSFTQAECVFVPRTGGAYLYATLTPRAAQPCTALSATDPRWATFERALARADPHQLVHGFALFDGAFQDTTGEVGPTGKPRGYRIHARHAQQIRLTANQPEGTSPCHAD